jgi:hypothetical protein
MQFELYRKAAARIHSDPAAVFFVFSFQLFSVFFVLTNEDSRGNIVSIYKENVKSYDRVK